MRPFSILLVLAASLALAAWAQGAGTSTPSGPTSLGSPGPPPSPPPAPPGPTSSTPAQPWGFDPAQPTPPSGGRSSSPPRASNVPGEPGVREIVLLGESGALGEALADARARGLGLREKQELEQLELELAVVVAPPGVDLDAALRGMQARHSDVEIAHNDAYGLFESSREVRRYARALVGWGQAPESCGDAMRLGLLDTLPDRKHPALRGQRIRVKSVLRGGMEEAPVDHGTAIAALLVGSGRAPAFSGLLPGASLFVAGAFRRTAAGEADALADRLVVGLDWLLARRVRVVNLSFGGPENRVLTRAVREVLGQGVLVVAAAGNDGPRAAPAHPAAQPDVLAVTAVNAKLVVYPNANRGRYIDLAAPGVDLWVAAPGGAGRYVSGTSYAAAFVTAALAAQVHQTGPGRAEATLTQGARDLGERGHDSIYGSGLLQTMSACSALAVAP